MFLESIRCLIFSAIFYSDLSFLYFQKPNMATLLRCLYKSRPPVENQNLKSLRETGTCVKLSLLIKFHPKCFLYTKINFYEQYFYITINIHILIAKDLSFRTFHFQLSNSETDVTLKMLMLSNFYVPSE